MRLVGADAGQLTLTLVRISPPSFAGEADGCCAPIRGEAVGRRAAGG